MGHLLILFILVFLVRNTQPAPKTRHITKEESTRTASGNVHGLRYILFLLIMFLRKSRLVLHV